MIGFILFMVFIGIFISIDIIFVINYFIPVFFKSKIKNVVFMSSVASIVIILLFCSIFPYIEQEKDFMLISEYNYNIELYKKYSNEYADGARKQISEYQKMQSEMARTATIAQLQFFAQQQDSVGNALTNEIRRFQILILEQELAINKANSRILRRPLNKWYFGI